jgi:CBS domain-containing protein
MTITAADTQVHVAELCDSAFSVFCDDLCNTFGIELSWNRQLVRTGRVADLWKPAKKLGVTHQVHATGTINGTFDLCFDQAGLFVLCGVIVMLPDAQIVQQVESGSPADARSLEEAAREAGNLLVGSWNRVFQEKCRGHRRFIKKGTFIGKPWEAPDGIGLAPDDEVLLASYEFTAGSYPSFHCAAVFPAIMGLRWDSASEGTAGGRQVEDEPADNPAEEARPAQEVPAVAEPDVPPPMGTASSEDEAEPVPESRSEFEPTETDHSGTDAGCALSGSGALSLLHLPVTEVMTKTVVWAEPDETVQQCIARMQQQDCRYVLVGRKGVLEGIVSASTIQAALSPYLRPMFARWRRPEDDATLGIKVKWIMSRPVRTVPAQATLAVAIESMFRHGGRCLPVVNREGAVQGVVTVFDILARLIEADPASSWKGTPRQSPPLLL